MSLIIPEFLEAPKGLKYIKQYVVTMATCVETTSTLFITNTSEDVNLNELYFRGFRYISTTQSPHCMALLPLLFNITARSKVDTSRDKPVRLE